MYVAFMLSQHLVFLLFGTPSLHLFEFLVSVFFFTSRSRAARAPAGTKIDLRFPRLFVCLFVCLSVCL